MNKEPCHITDEWAFNPYDYDEDQLTPEERREAYDEAQCDVDTYGDD